MVILPWLWSIDCLSMNLQVVSDKLFGVSRWGRLFCCFVLIARGTRHPLSTVAKCSINVLGHASLIYSSHNALFTLLLCGNRYPTTLNKDDEGKSKSGSRVGSLVAASVKSKAR